MSLNATSITLLFVGCAIAITPAISQDDTKDAGFAYFNAAEVQCMKHAEEIYVFSVQADSSKMPSQKDLRRLEPEGREALLATLCNPDNWNWVTGGELCEDRDIGVVFERGKDKLILRFCSKPADYIGFDADGTFNQKPAGGWIKQRAWEAWKQRFAQSEMRK
jgi:hypothetical protein